MSVPTNLNVALKKRPGGQIVNMLDWAINGGPAKWCDDVTYTTNKTIIRPYITAKNFTVNEGVTLTLTSRIPLIVVADTITINGTITASGKGCSGGDSDDSGYRYTGFDFGMLGAHQAVSQSRNYCLCGAGGGCGNTGVGGGAYGNGGGVGSAGADCDLTSAELKEILFSPLFNVLQMGMGGGGGHGGAGGGSGGAGGGPILLIAHTIVVSSTGSVLANGVDGGDGGTYGGGGGGGGFVGLIGDNLSVHGSATITADGGTKGLDTSDGSDNGGDGGDGVTVQVEV